MKQLLFETLWDQHRCSELIFSHFLVNIFIYLCNILERCSKVNACNKSTSTVCAHVMGFPF